MEELNLQPDETEATSRASSHLSGADPNQEIASGRNCRGHEEQVRLNIHLEPTRLRLGTRRGAGESKGGDDQDEFRTASTKEQVRLNIYLELIQETVTDEAEATKNLQDLGRADSSATTPAPGRGRLGKLWNKLFATLIWSRPKSRNCRRDHEEQVRLHIHLEPTRPRPRAGAS